jgi:hypothetical protein
MASEYKHAEHDHSHVHHSEYRKAYVIRHKNGIAHVGFPTGAKHGGEKITEGNGR